MYFKGGGDVTEWMNENLYLMSNKYKKQQLANKLRFIYLYVIYTIYILYIYIYIYIYHIRNIFEMRNQIRNQEIFL